ncbi:MAG TPA: hypothetical protein VIS76_06185 [Pseudomonadales bacterium]
MRDVLLDTWQEMSLGESKADRKVALLTDLRVLRFAGSDALSFLQGYLTIDTGRLDQEQARFAALTNLQGRVVANGWCRRTGPDTLDWAIHESLADRVAEFLRRYLAFSRTRLEVRQDDHLVLGLVPPDAAPSVQIVDDEAQLAALREGWAPVSAELWRARCVDQRVALVSLQTCETFLPQMLGLVDAGAVDFDKGCYLGQEVVARAQHRGEVKRGLLRLDGPPPALASGETLTDDAGKSLATVISAAPTAAGQHVLAVARLPPAAAYLCSGRRFTPY